MPVFRKKVVYIGTIRTSIQMFNGMTPGLRSMTNALSTVISSFESMQRVSSNSIAISSLQAARVELNRAGAAFSQVEASARDADQQQKKLNSDISRGTGLAGGLKGALAGIDGAFGIKKLLNISDEFARSTARIGLLTGGMESVVGLQDQIYQSAQRSRTSYLDTMDTVGKLGLRAGSVFKNPNETIAFVELLNKQFKIAGASQQEISSATQQLTQALGAGVLRGEEFNGVFDAAPKIMEAVADYMDKPIEKIRELASDGGISASIVKNAMFAMAEETEEQFNQIPHTWSDVWVVAVNKVIRVSQPLLKVIGGLANNWEKIEPFAIGAAVAVGIYATTLGIAKGIQASHIITTGISTAFNGAWTVSVFRATEAQNGLNTALLTCPITWIILAVIILVAVFYAIIAAINKWKETSISATGIIFGYFYWMFTNVYNLVAFVLNIFIIFVNYLENAFKNPTAAAQALFYDMCSNVIGYVEKMAAAIEAILNKIPGVQIDITSGLSRFKNELGERALAIKDRAGLVDSIKKWAYKDPREMIDKGYKKGADVANSTSGVFGDSAWDALANNTEDIAGNTGQIADSMEISQEELKYLRDMAEREAINRFTTAEIKVDFKNESTINSNLDIDGVVNKFTKVLREAVYTEAEEVHTLV
ncbi:tape measure protein [Anaerotignum sp.]|uniref:tape measure protein n=1 Tax=Anaerotignum sp. TaxID=2039241 RepID=UPI0028A6FD90|nr:tape measure protein [Anaerotignum sp.]